MKLPDTKFKQRTLAQNNALHLLFDQLADELNARGLDITSVIRIKMPWTKERVKYILWWEVMMKMTGKDSTTKLNTAEVDKILEVLQNGLIEIGVYDLKFPSIETLMEQNTYDKTR